MSIPRDQTFESSLAFLREGYEFIPRRCARLGTDAFRTRIATRPVICASGWDAARMFYHPGRFTRQKAMPPTVVRLLQDFGSVQALDGKAHHHRKAMWMRLAASDEAVSDLVEAFDEIWTRKARTWRDREVVLADEVPLILTEAALAWAGVPQTGQALLARNDEFLTMVEAAGRLNWRQLRAHRLRHRSEVWARKTVSPALRDPGAAPEGSAMRLIAEYRDERGRPLDVPSAGVELINALRPVTAVAVYVVFTALALHQNPQWRDRLRTQPSLVTPFVQEVRRLSPFFPLIAGRVRQSFTWRGRRFGEGEWVMLDLYGTSRDPAVWADADRFSPERFDGQQPGPYDMTPQGGGPHETTHRCPGERATIALLERAASRLVAMDYGVPAQDLGVSLSRIPTGPKSGMVIAPR